MIKFGITSLMGMFIGGWLIGVILYLWDFSRPIDLIILILACSLLIINSCIVWIKVALGK